MENYYRSPDYTPYRRGGPSPMKGNAGQNFRIPRRNSFDGTRGGIPYFEDRGEEMNFHRMDQKRSFVGQRFGDENQYPQKENYRFHSFDRMEGFPVEPSNNFNHFQRNEQNFQNSEQKFVHSSKLIFLSQTETHTINLIKNSSMKKDI